MPIRIRHCEPCGVTFQVLCRDRRGTTFNLTTRASSPVPTCGCGNTDLVKKPTAATIHWSGDEALPGSTYPYFDEHIVPGGLRIHDAAHHKRVMKQHGLTHITTEDIADARRAQSVARADTRRRGKEQREMEETHPDYAPWRRMRASGEAVERAEVPKKHRKATQAKLDKEAKEFRDAAS